MIVWKKEAIDVMDKGVTRHFCKTAIFGILALVCAKAAVQESYEFGVCEATRRVMKLSNPIDDLIDSLAEDIPD